MGQSRGGGYQRENVQSQGQSDLHNLINQIAPGYLQQAASGYQSFLPGGEGANAITNQANQQFQQKTVPSIMNQFGSGAKTSSALNQALAAGASDLNTNIASMLSQMQLQAAGGLGQLGSQLSGLGLGTDQFALLARQPGGLQRLLQAIAGGASGAVAGGATGGPAGAVAGGIQGGARGYGGY